MQTGQLSGGSLRRQQLRRCATSNVSFIKLWHEAAGDYGNDAVAMLNDHFGPVLRDAGIDTDSVEMEWALLKTLLHEQSPDV